MSALGKVAVVFTVCVLGLPAAAAAAGPSVAAAPGRVVFGVGGGAVQRNVDAGGAGFAVALPDGGALLFGSGRVAKIGPNGALDRSFGDGGVRSIVLPTRELQRILRQPNGKLLLIGVEERTGQQFSPGRFTVTRLNPDTTPDASFGTNGTVTTGIGQGCGACTTAALQPDGAIVLTGTTGEIEPPPAPLNLRWAVTRLTPAGALDASFGDGGIATIPMAISTSGFNVAIGPGGSIVTEAQSQRDMFGGDVKLWLTRLTPSGTPDTTFAGGTPVELPFFSGFNMLVGDDGSVVVNGQPPRTAPPTPADPSTLAPSPQRLARLTPAGAFDQSFGAGGIVDLGTEIEPQQLLAAGGRSVTVVGTPAYALLPGSFPRPGFLNARTIAADGSLSSSRDIELPFGGGGSSFLVSVRPRPVGPLRQNSFSGRTLTPRPDGSFLVAGGVSVTQPTGEGTGFSIGRFAAAALTPALALDPAFGGAATPLKLSVRLPRQRARTALTRHGIRIQLKASAEGLARVKITHRGRAIAHSLLPVFKTTRHTLPVELTSYGNRYLRRHRKLRVSITANGRDLLTNTAAATATGRLR